MNHVRKQYNIELYLMWCDADVYSHGWIKPNEPLPQVAEGGGGTSFTPPFNYLEEHNLNREIDFMVYFTDGWGSFPDPPDYRTIWVMYQDETPPFGETVRVDP
jgi:predicted metal-dependent peptidase